MSRTAGSLRSIYVPGTNGRTDIPFPAEDFRYWLEDVAPECPVIALRHARLELVQSEAPRFEVLGGVALATLGRGLIDLFLPNLAGADPLYIYCPSHYLKQFHEKFARGSRSKHS